MMTAKEYLSQVSQYNKRIEALIRTRDLLRQKALCNSSPQMNADKVGGSGGSGAPMADAVDRYVDIERELDEMQDEYRALILKIVKQIDAVGDPRFTELLRLRYIDDRQLKDIACIMRKSNGEAYTYDYIKRLHGYALAHFARRFLK